MKNFGCIESPVNENVHVYDNLCFNSLEVLPKKFTLQVPLVRHQGYSSHCVSFAGASMAYCDALTRHGKSNVLSPEYTHKYCKDIDNLPNAMGTTLEAWCKVITKYGVCDESLYPFDDSLARVGQFNEITDGMIKNAVKNKVTSYARISEVDKVKDAIVNQNGAIVGMRIFSTFDSNKKGYILPPPKTPNAKYYGLHCMFICGYDDEHEATLEGITYKGFFKIMDSYGTNEGSYGFRYLAYDLWDATAYYSYQKLVNECWCTYDKNTLVDPDYHIKMMENINDVLNVKKKVVKLTVGNNIAYVDGVKTKMTKAPVIISGTTFVPVRFISEAFGCYVLYDNTTKQVTVKSMEDFSKIVLTLGSKKAYINDTEYTLLVAPYADNGVTMLPLRAISEMLNKVVTYDNKTKEISIVG